MFMKFLKNELTDRLLSIALYHFPEVFRNMDALNIWKNMMKIIWQNFHLEDLEIL